MEAISETRTRPVWSDARAIALLMAASLTTMANATISPALPGLERLFAEDPHAALLTRLLVPAPSLSVALCAPFAGLAADRFGRRPLLLSGMILFVIAGCAGLVLPDLPAIFASRLVLGVAVALIMTAQTALIGDYFTGQERGALTALQISARNLGGLVFISAAALLAVISPRLPFSIYGLAALFLPLSWKVIVDLPRQPTGRSGGRSIAAGEVSSSWLAPFTLLVLLQAVTNAVFFIMPTQISFLLEARGFDGAVMTGAVLAVLMLSGGGFALLFTRIQRASASIGAFALGYAAMALGFLLLSAPTTPALFAAALAIGAGYALVSPGFVALALELAPARYRGTSGGALTASIFIGQFGSPLLSTPLIASHGYGTLLHGTSALLAALAGAAVLAGGWKRFDA